MKKQIFSGKYKEATFMDEDKPGLRYWVGQKEKVGMSEDPHLEVRFQEGNPTRVGLNGASNEALVAMILHRLEHSSKQTTTVKAAIRGAKALLTLLEKVPPSTGWTPHLTMRDGARDS